MPTYEYRCEKCEREFEADQRITDPPLKSCPHCRSRKVKRLISRTSFVLKGGGWYSDLYSSSAGKKPAEADAGGSAPGASAEGGGSSEGGKDAGAGKEASPADSGAKPKADAKGAGKKRSGKGAKAAA